MLYYQQHGYFYNDTRNAILLRTIKVFMFHLKEFLLLSKYLSMFFCSYFISRKPIDERPDYYFKIDQSGLNGTVSLKNSLDYEAVPKHIVRILAIDRGRTQDPENEC